MEKLLELLQILGVYVDDSAPPIVMLSLYFLVSSCFILLNVINICIYLLSIYIVSNERVLSKIPDRYVYVHKLLKFYKNIRIEIHFCFLNCKTYRHSNYIKSGEFFKY